MSLYIQNLKQILKNIILLYKKYFLHWNISKICVFVYENILGLLLSLPFLAIIVYQYFSIYSSLGLSANIEEFILGNIGALILTAVLFLCILIIFISVYTYGNFLMLNVYKSYLQGDVLPYTKNLYFSGKHFRAYIGILGWMSLYIVAPVLVGLALVIPLGLLMKNTEGVLYMSIISISFLVFIALIIWLLYVSIRLVFSPYTLLYATEIEKAKSYTDESFRLTKGKVWKIIFLALPFSLVLGIVANIFQTGEQKLMENRAYNTLVEIQKQSGQDDHKLLEGFFVGRSLLSESEKDKDEFKKIENAFKPMTNDIDKDFLGASMYYIDTDYLDKNGWIFTSIFMIFSFFVLEGFASMLYLSIYHVIISKNNETV